MPPTWVILAVAAAGLGVMFAVAGYGHRRAAKGKSLLNNGTVYALSLTVYATSWTYYGGVGNAVNTGAGFLAIYLGPTLMLTLGWLVLRRVIRISHRDKITSLADFVSARYGKCTSLGVLVTLVAVIGIVPYISLQLKAVSVTFETLRRATPDTGPLDVPVLHDSALYAALLLAGFTIIFGTRHLDTSERHEGMVAAIAFDAVVKLVAFIAAGVFVTFVLYQGFGDLYQQAVRAGHSSLFTVGEPTGTWVWQNVLSALAVLLLPRQWQIGVVENVGERHLKRAMWQFPLYLLVLCAFVLPIAAAGLLRLGDRADADIYVLALPMTEGHGWLALLVFVGGLSAATGMIIVETIALSTMVSNSVVLPLLLRHNSRLVRRNDLAPVILAIRRITIVAVLLLGFTYFRLTGTGTTLTFAGLVSFAAVAQFAPALIGGLFWKGGTARGAVAGLAGGFTVWCYTLLLPSFAEAGWLPRSLLTEGPFGIGALRPHQLFGLSGMDALAHSMCWSALVNIGLYAGVSLFGRRPTTTERTQALAFVDALAEPARPQLWRGTVSVESLRRVLARFLGPARATEALEEYARAKGLDHSPGADAAPALVHHTETLLAGVVGTASARILLTSLVGEEQLSFEEVMEMINHATEMATLGERHRLARELHDSVSQALFSMTLHTRAMELALQRNGTDPADPVARGLTELRALTQNALLDMRASLFQLRPGALHEDGLVTAIRKQTTAISARDGVEIAVLARDDRLPLSERAEHEIFRVVQEAVHNSIKHAGPRRIEVRLREDHAHPGALVIEVADDGRGFDPAGAHNGGMGLIGMRERVARLGGELVIHSTPNDPTTVRAVIPKALNARGERT